MSGKSSLSTAERTFIERMPKAELHVHLEGSVYPDVLLKLAEKHGRSLPFEDVEGARQWFQFRDFPHFVEIYIEICSNLRDVDDYVLITRELARRAAQQNIRYLEVTFSPSSILNPGTAASPDTAWTGIREGARQAREELDVELQFILDPVRGRSVEAVMGLAEWFSHNIGDGLVGFGLGGIELGNPASQYQAAFNLARAAGGHISIHAGETDGPASVRDALATGSERIGHGVRSIEDADLVAELAECQMLLEISPTSNICLGVYPDYAAHPFRRLYEAGVPVTVNSDDPPMFGTTLTNEHLVLASDFGFTIDELEALERVAIEHAFLPPDRKRALAERFVAECDALRADLQLPVHKAEADAAGGW